MLKKLWTIFLFLLLLSCQKQAIKKNDIYKERPRVFIFTDINIDQGDPDDRQSLIHLLWYADELTVEGIVPDRWNAQGYEACKLALNAYADDYQNYHLIKKAISGT